MAWRGNGSGQVSLNAVGVQQKLAVAGVRWTRVEHIPSARSGNESWVAVTRVTKENATTTCAFEEPTASHRRLSSRHTAMPRLLLLIAAVVAPAMAFHVPASRMVAAPAAPHLHAVRRCGAQPVCSEGIVRGIGEGRDLPAPSGINTQPAPFQAAIVLAIFAAIGLGTVFLHGPVFDLVRGSDLWNLSRPTWPILGLIYLAAGIAHFTELEGFTNITPPNGTWGFFYTPFSPKFNVLWTGVVEIFGGAWMLFGAAAPLLGIELPAALGPVVSDGALTLMLLTAIVTPANVYALTHGANFPLDLETPPNAHAVRLAFQSVLLAMLWEMATPTLIDAQVNLGLM